MSDKKQTIEVVRLGTNEVIHAVDVTGKSERQIEKVEMGMMRNMDLEKYSVRRGGKS